MPASTLSLVLPLALDGESITGNSTAIAVLSVVSIVGGYLLLFALWYFVFRDRSSTDKHQTRGPSLPESQDKHPAGDRGRRIRPRSRR